MVSLKEARAAGRVQDALNIWSASDESLAPGATERVSGGPGAIAVLADHRPDEFPRVGTWMSEEIEPGFGFVELLPSWNVATPPDAGIRVEGRVRIGGEWSSWLDFGYWGRVPPPESGETFEHGKVAVDILQLARPAEAYQLRVRLFSYRLDDEPPALLRLAAVASGEGMPGASPAVSGATIDLAVPFVAQHSIGERLGGDVCSPTCVTMVAAYYGVDRPLAEHALAIYDAEHGIFGNWNRAVARAGELGLAANVDRMASLEQAKAWLARGVPLVISIRFKEGECPSFVLPKTSGHLIVLRGVRSDGDFIVNDPASADRGERAIYTADELKKAWLENADGVAYVIKPAAE